MHLLFILSVSIMGSCLGEGVNWDDIETIPGDNPSLNFDENTETTEIPTTHEVSGSTTEFTTSRPSTFSTSTSSSPEDSTSLRTDVTTPLPVRVQTQKQTPLPTASTTSTTSTTTTPSSTSAVVPTTRATVPTTTSSSRSPQSSSGVGEVAEELSGNPDELNLAKDLPLEYPSPQPISSVGLRGTDDLEEVTGMNSTFEDSQTLVDADTWYPNVLSDWLIFGSIGLGVACAVLACVALCMVVKLRREMGHLTKYSNQFKDDVRNFSYRLSELHGATSRLPKIVQGVQTQMIASGIIPGPISVTPGIDQMEVISMFPVNKPIDDVMVKVDETRGNSGIVNANVATEPKVSLDNVGLSVIASNSL